MKSKILIPLLLFLLVIIGISIFIFGRPVNNTPNKEEITEQKEVKNPEQVIKENIKDKTFQEIAKDNPDSVKAPFIVDADTRNEVYKEVIKNEDPQNYTVNITQEGIEPSPIILIQGDYVSFYNKTNSAIIIKGKDSWGLPEIAEGEFLTSGFDFKGDFEYEVVQDEKTIFTGVVQVVGL